MSSPAISPPNLRFTKPRAAATVQPSYPKLLIQRVVELVGLSYRVHALDLDAGPAWLALDLAPFAKSFTLLGSDAARLATHTGQAPLHNKLRFVEGALHELPEQFGCFRLAVLGSSFRRLDRAAILTALDARLDVGGALALFEQRYPQVAENHWREGVDELLLRYVQEQVPTEPAAMTSDEAVLLQSAFDHVERLSVIERRETPVQRVVERTLVQAGIWRLADGAHEQRLAGELHQLLAPHTREGMLREVVDGHALVARRAKDLSGRWA